MSKRPADSYTLARRRKLRRTLKSQRGVLTRDELREVAHADRWHVPFGVALERAVGAGRVRELTDALFEAGPEA